MALDQEGTAFVRVPVSLLPEVIKALEKIDAATAQAAREFTAQYTEAKAAETRAAWLAKADGIARDGEIEVDSDAAISESDDGGAYVMAWLWVEADQCEACGEAMPPTHGGDYCTACETEAE